jgi:hypothetical protein
MKLKLCIYLILFFVTVFVSALSVTAEAAQHHTSSSQPPCFSTAEKTKLDSVLYFEGRSQAKKWQKQGVEKRK